MAISGRSWLEIPPGSHFSLANIPFGIISSSPSSEKHAAVAIGEHVLDLHSFARHDGFSSNPGIFTADIIAAFSQPALNDFAALGQAIHAQTRAYLQDVFAQHTRFPGILRDNLDAQRASLLRRDQVVCHLPMHIGGYTDFFAGKNHAYNCGCIFRDPANALQPNYLHLPVAYNSRASSVVVSGTGVRRPLGQFLENPHTNDGPSFGPCRRLDIELELGALLCRGNRFGEPIDVNEADDHIFGFVLLNDWSARDVQAWEAVPLGPFNSKSFATTISPWVVLKCALDPFRTPAMVNHTNLHPYLQQACKENVYDIELEVELKALNGTTATFSHTKARNLVFSFAQMIAHHTIGGCPLHVGDLIGSGTISGSQPGTVGSLLESSGGGKRSYELSSTVTRTFLEDGDCVTIRGWCGGVGGGGGDGGDDEVVGFGECSGVILPSVLPSWLEA